MQRQKHQNTIMSLRVNTSSEEICSIKNLLLDNLKAEGALWSYNNEALSAETFDDELLIELVLRHLDLDDIALLFQIYHYNLIKHAWLERLVPQGEYLYTLNRFFAWYYFKVKRPDSYLKAMTTRYFNRIA